MFVRASLLEHSRWRNAGPYACAAAGISLTAVFGTPMAAVSAAMMASAFLLMISRLRRQPVRRDSTGGVWDADDLPIDPSSLASSQLALVHHRLEPAHPVSGLPVREGLLAQMNADGEGLMGAIAFTDFDRLTAFDPSLGEQVLAASAARLRRMLPAGRCLAQIDRGHVALWFGAETEDDARAELDAIAYALSETIDLGTTNIVPVIEVRLARFEPASQLDASQFLARLLASFAISGKANATLAAQSSSDRSHLARDRYVLEQDLRHAMVRRELRLDFQPLIDAARGGVGGAEALLRWDHPERGAIPPAVFVPIVEAMGLASEIGMWVLNAAVREAQGWAALGLGNLRVAVNVSALQLERDDLPILVQRTLERHGVSANALEIELTESVATSDTERCRDIFQRLRALGVKLAVDDFGTGYSGFSSLRALAFDKIKIDREFVTDVDRRHDSQAICQSIIALGRGLGIRVLAEGVERHGEYDWLRRHGCEHFQGYYFARPLDGGTFAEFVRDTARLTDLLRLGSDPKRIEERLRA